MIPVLLDIIYCIALVVFSPVLLYRILVLGKYWGSLAERLGRISHLPARHDCIWLHGVSVGEVKAARTLVTEIKKALPNKEILISATSAAGRKMAASLYPDCLVVPFPLDFSWAIMRYFRYFQPHLLILMELELWPNLLLLANYHHIPVILVNGRLSVGSWKNYRLLGGLFPFMTRAIRYFAMQTEIYAERLKQLGIDEKRVMVTGNMKFDTTAAQKWLPRQPMVVQQLGLTPNLKVLVAGSTHAPEEKILLSCYRKLQDSFPELRLILVPRHPERAEEIAAWTRQVGLFPMRRSGISGHYRLDSDQVLIGDRMGELGELYTVAWIAFVGGSLIPHGGQNFLEPAGLGKAVVCGPFMDNFPDIRIFKEEQALIQLTAADSLEKTLTQLLRAPDTVRTLGEKAQELVSKNQGSSLKNCQMIVKMLNSATNS